MTVFVDTNVSITLAPQHTHELRSWPYRMRPSRGRSDTLWKMSVARLTSKPDPTISVATPEAAHLAVQLVARAQAMGLLGEGPHPRRFDLDAFADAVGALEAAGIARRAVQMLHEGDGDVVAALAEVHVALEGSALPEREWGSVTAVLGEELTGELVGVSSSSLRRYRSGQRRTPDGVAVRLHQVALIVADLAGAYNDRGVRRWFSRPRAQLDGRAPAELLEGAWEGDETGPTAVAELAGALAGAGPAT